MELTADDLSGKEPLREYTVKVYGAINDQGDEASTLEPAEKPGEVIIDLINVLCSLLTSCGLHQSSYMLHEFPAQLVAEQRANVDWKARKN